MEMALKILNEMKRRKLIGPYATGGGVVAIRHPYFIIHPFFFIPAPQPPTPNPQPLTPSH